MGFCTAAFWGQDQDQVQDLKWHLGSSWMKCDSRCGGSRRAWRCTGPSPACPGWSAPCEESRLLRSCIRSAPPGPEASPRPVNNNKGTINRSLYNSIHVVAGFLNCYSGFTFFYFLAVLHVKKKKRCTAVLHVFILYLQQFHMFLKKITAVLHVYFFFYSSSKCFLHLFFQQFHMFKTKIPAVLLFL